MVDRNAKPTFHPPAELQTAIEYIPIQGRQGGPQNFNNKRQAPPTDPGPSNSQDVRFIDGVVESHYDEGLEKNNVNSLRTPMSSPLS